MDKDQAKKLMEIESCITHFLDLFLKEVEKLPESQTKEILSRGTKEVIGYNLTEMIFPIISSHPSLNPYSDNSMAFEWFKNSKNKYLA